MSDSVIPSANSVIAENHWPFSSQVTSRRSLNPTRALSSGIKATSTVTTKIVKPGPLNASPQDGTMQDLKAVVQDMVRSSLTQPRFVSLDLDTHCLVKVSTYLCYIRPSKV